ncbi:flagellar export chaperone FliS [Candidatus Magnetominusculus xianensis]|uniref:Flagellar secretion chaperone FliS n=1 Tax=Candidatus Magnetominusculus xianensis TaxID=1748249 RepID=A0ABR5SG94_9BACT|nr:flagellar export chaperone FliS [Candidatus Magnetominusculus xianensis]KWT84075.1 flagellar protein FliS [Candidatus Magnetominusculus xianensis]MBF0402368.1 flagellar export chaperone FliS [Nitrospirota bacterium]
MTNPAYAKNAYISTDINNLSPLDLVIKLYDGAIGFLSKAVFSIEKKNRPMKIQYLNKTRAIVEELMSSLDMEVGGEVAVNLHDLYTYMLLELTRINSTDSVDKIYHIQELLRTLKSAWVEVKAIVPQSPATLRQHASIH